MERHGGGKVLVGDVGFVLALPHDPERVRAPDVAFVTTSRLPEGRLPAGFLREAPDLAVEVLSDNPVDVQQKLRDYLDAGARLVWAVAPEARSATIYRADGSARLLRHGDSGDGEDVLPGLDPARGGLRVTSVAHPAAASPFRTPGIRRFGAGSSTAGYPVTA